MESLDTLVFDKTGTLTKGKLELTDIVALEGQEKEVLKLAASAEKNSEHPLAEAIVMEAQSRQVKFDTPAHFQSIPGKGVEAQIEDQRILLGTQDLMKQFELDTRNFETRKSLLEQSGKTVVYLAKENNILGLIAVQDQVKEDAKKAIGLLQQKGKAIWMITGDNEKTAQAIGKQLGITNILAQVLPDQKAKRVQELQNEKKRWS